MGIFKGVKALFKMPDIVDMAIKTGDALVWTQEERKNWVIETAKVLGPQTIARRAIAVMVSRVWAVLTGITAILILLLMFSDRVTGQSMKIWMEFYLVISILFGGINTFYFGTGAIRATNGK